MGLTMFFLAAYILLSISLYFVFQKAGKPGWQGLVPGYNFVVWTELIGRKAWYAAFLLIPLVNIFIYAGMSIEMVRSFKKYSFWHSVLAVIATPLFFGYLGLSSKEEYDGPTVPKEKAYKAQLQEAVEKGNKRQLKKLQDNNPYKKGQTREWAEAIIFAVFAAAFIRMFLIEAYVIPTPSMEGSLLVGDYLFVSKAHYGIRTPQTIAMIPLLHNRIPVVGGKSYLDKPQLEYKRLPAIESIDHNDPVVFNMPVGDSVYVFPGRVWTQEDYKRGLMPEREKRLVDMGRVKLITRPVDKKDHYIKRCVGLPGDSLQIIDRQVYINGEPAENPRYMQFIYLLQNPGGGLINTRNFDKWGIYQSDLLGQPSPNSLRAILNQEQIDKIKASDPEILIHPIDIGQFNDNPRRIFPGDPTITKGWSVDNFGPIYIPKAGETVQLTPQNMPYYERIINVYEDNELEKKDGKIFINGQPADSYTFKLDYYWMMGDNRHNSEDARIWGYVPETHIVGKPLFIWFSTKEGNIAKGINWKRIFSSADKR